MHEQDTRFDHDEVELLLPWFVNDTLARAERQQVQRHLEVCTTCQDSIAVLQKMQDAARTDAAIPMVPSPRIDDLMSAIAADDLRRAPRRWWPAMALAASAAAILLAAVLIANNPAVAPESGVRFETATSESAAALMDYVMAVEFEPGTTAIKRRQAFEAYDVAEFVAESEPDTYRIMLRLPVSSLEDLERVTNEMESHADIRSVRILALQLPMR
ncbi:MAG: zf-HC2 domain-containing protein [Gammaproteobacteria bacterium]|nr:zf-HC2 domain-containing protein [Gammaproteobacteria bacterium]MDH3431307.1 zf-HC2 domain-containing protein [Gammaproteobacteria bacterium]MDH3435027.1 zf-HC2 domain-containing protein [Gammaproteobacteria bacterium]